VSPFDAKVQDWRERASRYGRLSSLLGEDKSTAPLRALTSEMQQQLERLCDLTDTADHLMRYSAVLTAELDFVLARGRANRLRAPGSSTEDLREESRLCLEEAKAAVDDALRGDLASRAFALAQFAEAIDRGETSPEDGRALARRLDRGPPADRNKRDFVARQNVERYRRILATGGLDDTRRRMIEMLLNEALAKLADGR
jgi:hypothetical protein